MLPNADEKVGRCFAQHVSDSGSGKFRSFSVDSFLFFLVFSCSYMGVYIHGVY